MIESFVDLTYRGLFLGRRIKLTQVRPNSGTLELTTPMPVGTHVAITTEEGVTFDATVSGVHEQVTGSDRTPGMVVVPVLAADPALSWWQARVALPEEDKPKPRAPRSRPMTERARTLTDPAPPPEEALTDPELPAIIADLDARVAAAAGVARPEPAGDPVSPAAAAQPARGADDDGVVRHGEHAVIDDGQNTMAMAALDPAALGGDPGADDDPEASEAGEAGEAGEASEAGETSGGDKPPAGRGQKKRRKRR